MNQDWEAKQAIRAAQARALQTEYPHLVPANGNALIAAAKNVRIELATAFPGVKFSVKTSRFSMGNDLRVSWTDGPNTKQVDAIIDKYSAGSFDGMTDSYTYAHDVWTDAFGEAKYVFSTRHYSDRVIESVMGRICRHFGGIETMPTLEDYKQGRLWNVKQSRGCDMSREINIALQKHTCSVGQS